MSLSTSQPHDQAFLSQHPLFSDKTKQVNSSLNKFLHQDLQHWKSDLEERRREGEYFLEWFSWRKPNPPESEIARNFQRMVGPELASLSRLIDNFSKSKSIFDMDQLLAAQKAYLNFCDRFDRIRQQIMKKIDLKGNTRIY